MDCDVSREDLARFAANEASRPEAARIERHLEACGRCSERLEGIRKADAALLALAPAQLPLRARHEARRALSREIRGEEDPAEIMTLDDVARYLRVGEDALREIADDLPAFEIGGRIRIRKARLIEWIEGRERAYGRGRVRSDVAGIVHPRFTLGA